MVSQSRLYFALLTTVATMAFWLGMWSNSVSNYDKFTLPKPLRAVLTANDAFTEGKKNIVNEIYDLTFSRYSLGVSKLKNL